MRKSKFFNLQENIPVMSENTIWECSPPTPPDVSKLWAGRVHRSVTDSCLLTISSLFEVLVKIKLSKSVDAVEVGSQLILNVHVCLDPTQKTSLGECTADTHLEQS